MKIWAAGMIVVAINCLIWSSAMVQATNASPKEKSLSKPRTATQIGQIQNLLLRQHYDVTEVGGRSERNRSVNGDGNVNTGAS